MNFSIEEIISERNTINLKNVEDKIITLPKCIKIHMINES